MSYTFKTAVPVIIEGVGAKKAVNPFKEAVADIAWKTNPTTGKPEALSFVEECDNSDEKVVDSIKGKIARLLTDAGKQLKKPGTVRRAFQGVDGGLLVTFWVVPLQERPRKKETDK